MGSTYNDLMNNSAHVPAAEFLQLIEIHLTYRQNSTKIAGSNVNKF